MTPFARIRTQFAANWTTVFVGWKGLGAFSPWQAHSAEFPPLLSVKELGDYANERIRLSTETAEDELILRLSSLDLPSERRETIIAKLAQLSEWCRGDPSHELRKWRAVLLEDVLADLPRDPLSGMLALTEFWQGFGYPSDSPHLVQGKGNTVSPADYYREDNYERVVACHRAWLSREKAELQEDRE